MQKSKIESLLGFAVKAGKVLYGSDSLSSPKARYYVICMCRTTAPNTQKKVAATAQLRSVPILVAEKELQYTVGRKNCKVLAITDKQMSEAMLKGTDEEYHLFHSEVK